MRSAFKGRWFLAAVYISPLLVMAFDAGGGPEVARKSRERDKSRSYRYEFEISPKCYSLNLIAFRYEKAGSGRYRGREEGSSAAEKGKTARSLPGGAKTVVGGKYGTGRFRILLTDDWFLFSRFDQQGQ
ncbi:MAG: hypothetical protein JXB45_07555 [Candidatus Krumholzibacteriota bacterium]|nr:hypothetical protein [Candidatus Krumholzibacteriota bacterium]